MILGEEFGMIRKESPQTMICVSTLIGRYDKAGLAEMGEYTYRRLKGLYVEERHETFEKSNDDKSYLNRGRLHLNRQGNARFAY